MTLHLFFSPHETGTPVARRVENLLRSTTGAAVIRPKKCPRLPVARLPSGLFRASSVFLSFLLITKLMQICCKCFK